MLEIWKKTLNKLSGNLTTNEYISKEIKVKLLEEDLFLKNNLYFKSVNFPQLDSPINKIKGLNILSGLQKINKKGCLTVYRAVRFPTYRRINEMIYNKGLAIANYEQERILELYRDKKYVSKRKEIKKDRNFWTQPQERVINGLPVFVLVNDVLQIHRAFRNEKDKAVIIIIHIPYNLLKDKKIKLVANAAIDLEYNNAERDFKIKDFVYRNGVYTIDYKSLRVRGIDLHEMYVKNLPWDLKECEKLNIEQKFFLLDIYEIKIKNKIEKLLDNSKALRENQYFLHGFFGDQNIFGRRKTKYLPYKCQRILKK